MNSATIIFPNQLFEDHPALAKDRPVYVIEHARFFTDFAFHKQKLILHRASMQCFQDELIKKKYKCFYLSFNKSDALFSILKKEKIKEIHVTELHDHKLEKKIKQHAKKQKIKIIIHETPQFLTPMDLIKKELSSKKNFLMHSFYIKQRKRLKILVTKAGKPVGGKWSFDKENRKTIPEGVKIPSVLKSKSNKYLKEAREYIEKNFKNNPGNYDSFCYPINAKQAKHQFQKFLTSKLKNFGTYQDAIVEDKPFLFHSILSPALNIGLITPKYVIEKTLNYAKKNDIKLNNLEGFIRQIIGWREYVRAIYLLKGEEQSKSNFFKNKRKLPHAFWSATTAIYPIDMVVQRVVEYAYAHHIERLMILGNFMLLCEIDPKDVYAWFMELFIDAYDWVMVPNVYGMSQYADGGLITTKPYISSSNYVLKMSNFEKNDWNVIWDALYWNFIFKNKKLLQKSARSRILTSPLSKMRNKTLEKHLSVAKKFLATLKHKN